MDRFELFETYEINGVKFTPIGWTNRPCFDMKVIINNEIDSLCRVIFEPILFMNGYDITQKPKNYIEKLNEKILEVDNG